MHKKRNNVNPKRKKGVSKASNPPPIIDNIINR